jgi:hypothetical protein
VINGVPIGKRVRHPGFAPKPFMRPALDAKAGEAVQVVAGYFSRYLQWGSISARRLRRPRGGRLMDGVNAIIRELLIVADADMIALVDEDQIVAACCRRGLRWTRSRSTACRRSIATYWRLVPTAMLANASR